MPLAWLTVSLLVAQGAEVNLSAERVLHETSTQRTTGEGHAQLVTSSAALDAERIVYDQGLETATATGDVVLRLLDGSLFVITADLVTVRFDGEEVRDVYFLEGLALGKTKVTREELLAAHTPQEARALGRSTVRMEGNHLHKDGSRWTVEQLALVPCDCDFERPSWTIRSPSSVIDTDARRVSTLFPSIWVRGVPVLWLPWLSLPLSDRQTGLLFPRIGGSAQSGFAIEEPLFITLGRSADLTLVPGYFSGTTTPLTTPFGVQGPRLSTEFRYAPARGTTGRIALGLLYDLRLPRDPVVPRNTPTDGVRGLRGDVIWQHAQDFGHGFGARVDFNAHSDGYYQRDIVTDVIAREAGYLRSSASLFHRGDDHLVGLDAVLRQDLSYGYSFLGQAAALPQGSYAPRWGPNTLQRWPGLTFHLPTRRLAGPFTVSVEASAVRLAPLSGGTGDEGMLANEGRLTDATGAPLTPDCLAQRLYFPFNGPRAFTAACNIDPLAKFGQGDRVWERGEREARDRLDVFPRIGMALTPGGVMGVSAFAGWRQGLWLGELSGTQSQRGYPVFGAKVETELSRTFAGLRHVIVPSLELRSIPVVLGTAPAPYDDIDLAVPDQRGRLQAVAELRQRLVGGPTAFQLSLGQGMELAGPQGTRLSETYGRFSAAWGPFRALAEGRFDPLLARFTRVSASASVGDARRQLAVGWEDLLDDGTARSRQPIDLLFGSPAPASATSHAQLFTAGGRYVIGDFSLRYDLQLFNKAWALPDGTSVRPLTLMQHTLGVAWTPACDCWRVEVTAIQRPDSSGTYLFPEIGGSVTVTRFGSIGTAGASGQ